MMIGTGGDIKYKEKKIIISKEVGKANPINKQKMCDYLRLVHQKKNDSVL